MKIDLEQIDVALMNLRREYHLTSHLIEVSFWHHSDDRFETDIQITVFDQMMTLFQSKNIDWRLAIGHIKEQLDNRDKKDFPTVLTPRDPGLPPPPEGSDTPF